MQPERLQLTDAPARPAPHPRGEILARLLDDEPRGGGGADQANRRTGHAQADLDLGTHGHPLDERAEDVGEKRVALVAAVVANLLTEQARGDAEADFSGGLPLGHGRE